MNLLLQSLVSYILLLDYIMESEGGEWKTT